MSRADKTWVCPNRKLGCTVEVTCPEPAPLCPICGTVNGLRLVEKAKP